MCVADDVILHIDHDDGGVGTIFKRRHEGTSCWAVKQTPRYCEYLTLAGGKLAERGLFQLRGDGLGP